jgi:hypothetical protein
MLGAVTGESETSNDVCSLQIREFIEYLLVTKAGSQQIQYIAHPDAHAPDAWVPAAFGGVKCDSFHCF